LTPYDPARTPTTKDFAEKGGPVEKGQSSWLRAPDRPEQGGDKIDVLLFYKSHQISDDGARLIRVARSIGDDRCAIRARQLEYKPQMFRLGSVERFARNSASIVRSIHPRGGSHADGAPANDPVASLSVVMHRDQPFIEPCARTFGPDT
jgi:hypothetical protein